MKYAMEEFRIRFFTRLHQLLKPYTKSMFKHEKIYKVFYTIISMCHVNNKCSSEQVIITESVIITITTRETQASKPSSLVSISSNNHNFVTRIDL